MLHFLGLSSCGVKSVRRSAAHATARTRRPHSAKSHYSDRGWFEESTGGNGFLTNERLHRRHRITREELQTLSAASYLGEATEQDYLLVLETIRMRHK